MTSSDAARALWEYGLFLGWSQIPEDHFSEPCVVSSSSQNPRGTLPFMKSRFRFCRAICTTEISLFSGSFIFWHLLSHSVFYHLAPINIWRALPPGPQPRCRGTLGSAVFIMSAVKDSQPWTFAPWSLAGHHQVHINNSSGSSTSSPR